MSDNFEKWTKKEFVAYLMLYAANIDGNITPAEQKIIYNKADLVTYEDVFTKFEADNDEICLQNILGYKQKFLNSPNEIKQIIDEIKDIFMENKKISNFEQQILYLIEKILTQ